MLHLHSMQLWKHLKVHQGLVAAAEYRFCRLAADVGPRLGATRGTLCFSRRLLTLGNVFPLTLSQEVSRFRMVSRFLPEQILVRSECDVCSFGEGSSWDGSAIPPPVSPSTLRSLSLNSLNARIEGALRPAIVDIEETTSRRVDFLSRSMILNVWTILN